MPDAGLRRSLTLTDAILINVGTMLASGIFIAPSDVARQLSGSLLHLFVWAGAGVFSVLGALVIAELGAMMPHAGGIYVYLERAFGPIWGFLYGWALFTAIQCGAIAAVAVATATYLGYFVPLGPAGGNAVAIASILALTWINTRGVSEGAFVQNLLTVTKVGAVLLLVALALRSGDASRLSPWWAGAGAPGGLSLLGPIGLATVSALWCYDGWIHVSYIAGEVRDPDRTLPRAALASTLIVIGIYLALNLAYLVVLGAPGMASSGLVASDTARVVLGPAGGALVAALVAVSTLGANNGFILAGARVYYAMARDGLFFRSAARIDPATSVPAVSLLMQAGWSSVLVFSGTYDQLYTYVIFVEFLFYALAAAAVIRLRRREPGALRPYRVRGYPWTPLAFILFSAALLASTIASAPAAAGWGTLVMASGVPAFFFWRWRSRTRQVRPSDVR